MSNVAVFNPSANVPAFARNNALSETAKALTGGGSNSKRISIKGGVFRLIANGEQVGAIDDRHLDVIIVKAAPKVARTFYMAKYDADATPTAPDCWSNDGEKPDASIENPQASACMSCPQNVAGSGQKNSRACRYQQRLAVVLANNPDGDVLQLTLPATSIFGKEEGDKRPLQAFARYLAAQTPPINPEQIVTRMRFDTAAEAPKLFFQPMRWLTDDEYEIVLRQAETTDAQKAIVMTPAQVDGAKPAAAPALTGSAPKAAKQTVAEAFDEDEAAAVAETKKKATKKAKAEVVEDDGEPEVRKESVKTNAVPEKKSALADIVADWDDEE